MRRAIALVALMAAGCVGADPAAVPVATAYVVTTPSSSVPAGSVVTVTAQLVDESGEALHEAGRLVTWSSTAGGSFAAPTSTTGPDGRATVVFTPAGTAGTWHTVTARDAAGLTGSSAPVEVRVGPPASLEGGGIYEAVVGGDVSFAMRVLDALGNPVPGVVVTFAVTGGGGTVRDAALTTDAGGRVGTGWELGAAGPNNTLTASVPGVTPLTITAVGYNPPPTCGQPAVLVVGEPWRGDLRAGACVIRDPVRRIEERSPFTGPDGDGTHAYDRYTTVVPAGGSARIRLAQRTLPGSNIVYLLLYAGGGAYIGHTTSGDLVIDNATAAPMEYQVLVTTHRADGGGTYDIRATTP